MANPFRPFMPQQAQDANQNLLHAQHQVFLAFEAISKVPLLDGRLLKDVTLTTGYNEIPHGLNREPTGWFLVRNTTADAVYDDQANEAVPLRFLRLYSAANKTVSIWVF